MKASQALEPSEDDAMMEVWAGARRVDRLGEIEIRILADLAETAGQGDRQCKEQQRRAVGGPILIVVRG